MNLANGLMQRLRHSLLITRDETLTGSAMPQTGAVYQKNRPVLRGQGKPEGARVVLLITAIDELWLRNTEIYFLDKGDAVDFMQRRDARKNFLQCGFAQARQAFGLRRATNFRTWPALDDHLANIVAEIE